MLLFLFYIQKTKLQGCTPTPSTLKIYSYKVTQEPGPASAQEWFYQVPKAFTIRNRTGTDYRIPCNSSATQPSKIIYSIGSMYIYRAPHRFLNYFWWCLCPSRLRFFSPAFGVPINYCTRLRLKKCIEWGNPGNTLCRLHLSTLQSILQSILLPTFFQST